MSGAITAEERARAAFRELALALLERRDASEATAILGAAIRAAEAAALKRAAGVADAIERQAVGGEGCVGGAFFDRKTAHAIAHGIRSLKSDGSGK
jgi:hypothetical protein